MGKIGNGQGLMEFDLSKKFILCGLFTKKLARDFCIRFPNALIITENLRK